MIWKYFISKLSPWGRKPQPIFSAYFHVALTNRSYAKYISIRHKIIFSRVTTTPNWDLDLKFNTNRKRLW